MDAQQAEVTPEEDHLPSAVLALFFSREKDLAVPFPRRSWSRILCTHDIIVLHLLGMTWEKTPVRVTAPRFELTSQRQKVSRLPTESTERPVACASDRLQSNEKCPLRSTVAGRPYSSGWGAAYWLTVVSDPPGLATDSGYNMCLSLLYAPCVLLYYITHDDGPEPYLTVVQSKKLGPVADSRASRVQYYCTG